MAREDCLRPRLWTMAGARWARLRGGALLLLAVAAPSQASEPQDREPAATVGSARRALQSGQPQRASELLAPLLAAQPDRVDALALRAALQFRTRDRVGFRRSSRKLRALRPRDAVMARAMLEVIPAGLRDRDMLAILARSLAQHPNDAILRAGQGRRLLLAGEFAPGLAALDRAIELDPRDQASAKLARLVREQFPQRYDRLTLGRFSVWLPRDERLSIEPYLGELLQQAHTVLSGRYGVELDRSMRVELYQSVEELSRWGGAGVELHGLQADRLIATLSPGAGPFNWGQNVWHEMAHAFHVKVSRGLVPRWFTEGLAQVDTAKAQAHWRREGDFELQLALRAGMLPPMGQLGILMMDPRNANLAYVASHAALDYLVRRYGFDKVSEMLRAWGQGWPTQRVFEEVLGSSAEAVDRAWREQLTARLANHDRDYVGSLEAERPGPVAAVLDLLARDELDRAAAVASGALRSSPNDPVAHYVTARVALARGKSRLAARCLTFLLRSGKDGYRLRALLADVALRQRDHVRALREARAAVALDPARRGAWEIMLRVAHADGNDALIMEALDAMVMLDQHAREPALDLAARLKGAQLWERLVRHGERTLFLEPRDPALHAYLGEAYLHTNEPAKARRELELALALHHPSPSDVRAMLERVGADVSTP